MLLTILKIKKHNQPDRSQIQINSGKMRSHNKIEGMDRKMSIVKATTRSLIKDLEEATKKGNMINGKMNHIIKVEITKTMEE